MPARNVSFASHLGIEYVQNMESYILRHTVDCAGFLLILVLLARSRAELVMVAHTCTLRSWESEAGLKSSAPPESRAWALHFPSSQTSTDACWLYCSQLTKYMVMT